MCNRVQKNPEKQSQEEQQLSVACWVMRILEDRANEKHWAHTTKDPILAKLKYMDFLICKGKSTKGSKQNYNDHPLGQ